MKKIYFSLILLLFGALCLPAATYVVINTDDAGSGSFRQAVLDANANPGLDNIDFAIPGSGVHTIYCLSRYQITDPVIINGFSQSGSSIGNLWGNIPHTLMIELDGSLAAAGNGGILYLAYGSGGSTIKGLIINNKATQVNGYQDGITIFDGNTRVESCYLGTDATGTIGKENCYNGSGISIYLSSSSSSGNVIIGSDGTSPADGAKGNLISSNSTGVGIGSNDDGAINSDVVIGQNFIGTNVSGTAALPNGAGIHVRGSSHLVYHNLISGQTGWGVGALSPGSLDVELIIKANFIGTDIAGQYPIPNGTGGGSFNQAILFWNSTHNSKFIIGGTNHTPYTCDGDANLISGNAGRVLWTNNSTGSIFQGNFVGVDVDGTDVLSNGDGIHAALCDQFLVGGNTPEAANIFSNNGFYDVSINEGTDIWVMKNRFGTNAMGTAYFPDIPTSGLSVNISNCIGDVKVSDNIFNQFMDGAISVDNYAPNSANDSMRILNNYIGLLADGLTSGKGSPANLDVRIFNSTQFTIGDGSTVGRNLVTGGAAKTINNGILIESSNNFNIANNYVGFNSTGNSVNTFGTSGDAVVISNSSNGKITNNLVGNSSGNGLAINSSSSDIFINKNIIGTDNTGTIDHSNGIGIVVYSASQNVTMTENIIAFNRDLGIDLNGDGVTINDSGDSDSGPNNLLNFPFIASQSGDDITIKLDVPAGNYRIEFFANPDGYDPSSHGEGQVYLGYGNVIHTGSGIESFTLAIAGSGAAANLSSTTTLIDGASPFGFGPTSEFSGPCVIQKICPNDIIVSCGDPLDPSFTGNVITSPTAYCPITVTYTDGDLFDECGDNAGKFYRTFKVALTDNPAVYEECVQKIEVQDVLPPIFSSVNGNLYKRPEPTLVVPSDDGIINYLETIIEAGEVLYEDTPGKLGPDPGDITDYVPGSTENLLYRIATYPITPDCSDGSVSIDAMIDYSYTYQTPPSIPGDDYNYVYAFIIASDGTTYSLDMPSIAFLEGEVLPNTNYKLRVSASNLPYNPIVSYSLCILSLSIADDGVDHINFDVTYSFDRFDVYMNKTNCPKDTTYVSCPSEIPTAATLTATDACGIANVTMAETTTGTEPCDYIVTRTWTATDACNNTNEYAETYVVKDETPPMFSTVEGIFIRLHQHSKRQVVIYILI